MREVIFFICDICGDGSEDRERMIRHENFCRSRKEIEDREIAERKAFGQLTIRDIISKCEKLPNLPIMIVSEDITEFNGFYPDGTNSYRGCYSELAIDVSNESVLLSSFLDEMRESLQRYYYGWKGGEYRMCENTLVWLSKTGVSSGIAVTDVRLASDEEMIWLCVKKIKH